MTKHFAAVCLMATALAAPAFAQTDTSRNYITSEADGVWRASKMIGVNVYNDQQQKVGDINEVLLNRDGKVEGVVIGVGGFLGIGERNVAVPYGDLKWSMTPVDSNRTAANNTSTGTNTAAMNNAPATPGGAGAPAPGLGNPASPVNPAPGTMSATTPMATRVNNGPAAYPDHAILANASKDQLQKAPKFEYGGAPR